MGRRGLFIGVGVLLIVSVIGVVGAFMVLNNSGGGGGGQGTSSGEPTSTPTPAPTAEPMVEVVIALQPLERGVTIVPEALGKVKWPESSLKALPSLITDTTQLVGKRARFTIAPGEPVLSTMVVESLLDLSPQGSDAAAQIPPEYVAISIPYDKNDGVALGVKDGDHVNIILSWAFVDIDQNFQSELPNITYAVSPPNPEGTIPGADTSEVSVVKGPYGQFGRGENGVGVASDFYVAPSEPQRPRFVTQGIIQDALVLHLGDFGKDKTVILPTATPVPVQGTTTPTAPPPPTSTPVPPSIITLVVKPQDALVLAYVKRLAERYPGSVKVTLALRSAGDTSQAVTDSVTLQYMFEKFNIALPAKLNYGVAGPAVVTLPTPAP